MSIRFAVSLGSREVLLNTEELEQFLNIVNNKETVESEYTKDEDGKYQTIYKLNSFVIAKHMNVRPILDDDYDALKFFTAVSNSKE